jgi:hypothetical protein
VFSLFSGYNPEHKLRDSTDLGACPSSHTNHDLLQHPSSYTENNSFLSRKLNENFKFNFHIPYYYQGTTSMV